MLDDLKLSRGRSMVDSRENGTEVRQMMRMRMERKGDERNLTCTIQERASEAERVAGHEACKPT